MPLNLVARWILAAVNLLDEVVGVGESWHQPKGPKQDPKRTGRPNRRLSSATLRTTALRPL
jgi:hypothetical protein